MSRKKLVITFCVVFIVFTVAFWGIVGFPLLEEASKSEVLPSIQKNHIDQDGTIWVTIDGKEYYLYINDNGVQKRLEMK